MRRAKQAAPFEACGFIMESGEIIEIRNVATNPMRNFKMDRQDLIEKLCNETDFISAIWHTHPGGSTVPSHTDITAIKMGAVQRNWDYLVVTEQSVNLYYSGSLEE